MRLRTLLRVLLMLALLATAWPKTPPKAVRRPSSGVFDYYVLDLSWAPSFCASQGAMAQEEYKECVPSEHYAFVVHGLWPALDQSDVRPCPTAGMGLTRVSQNVVLSALSLLPSETLIQREWRTHGICTGLSDADYFKAMRDAFQSVTIPTRYNALKDRVDLPPSQIVQEFAQANPPFGPDAFRVNCQHRFQLRASELNEVLVCFTKELRPRFCGRISGCAEKSIVVRPFQ